MKSEYERTHTYGSEEIKEYNIKSQKQNIECIEQLLSAKLKTKYKP